MQRSIFHHRRHHSVSNDNISNMAPPAWNLMTDDNPHFHSHSLTQMQHRHHRQKNDNEHRHPQHQHRGRGTRLRHDSHSQAPTTRQSHPSHQKQRSLFGNYTNSTSHQQQHLTDSLIMEKATLEFLGSMEMDSVFFQENQIEQDRTSDDDMPHNTKIPSFDKSEIVVGGVLGMGEFGVVMKVTGVNTSPAPAAGAAMTATRASAKSPTTTVTTTTTNAHDDADQQQQVREETPSLVEHIDDSSASEADEASSFLRMKQKCQSCTALTELDEDWLTESTRSTAGGIVPATTYPPPTEDEYETLRSTSHDFQNLAIKRLRKDLYPKKKMEACKDLAREAKFLARLYHPNIVRLRGLVSTPGLQDFGILLDRLSSTLDEQTKRWSQQCLDSSQYIFPWQSQQRISEFQRILLERLKALCDVSKAIRYLHSNMILFRDLKAENCGQLSFQSTEEKVFQIYDFGLAKELKPVDCLSSSPESSSSSFGRDIGDIDNSLSLYRATGLTGTLRIMAPEVIQCQPYGLKADIYSLGIVIYEVFAGQRCQLTAAEICKGQRPAIPPHMAHPIKNLLEDCWSTSISQRPKINTICKLLELEIDRIKVAASTTTNTSNSSSSSSIATATAPSSSSSYAGLQHQQ